MNLEIISKLADFKRTILYENRFFISNHPFLVELKNIIERDLESQNPILRTTLSEGNILYRARIINNDLGDKKYYITKMMQQYQFEVEHCSECEDYKNGNCHDNKSTDLGNVEFKDCAREKIESVELSSDPRFNGFGRCDSSLPPKENSYLVSDMRANPKYIRYLYAANDKYTSLLEARANIDSLVSVANLEIIKPIRIFDITNSCQYNIENNDMGLLLDALNDEFSTPVSGELKDYLVSQVVSEFIKNLDYTPPFDGICFRSSLNPKGRNYTIFSEEKYTPVSSEVYFISEIGLTAYGITEKQKVKIDSCNPNS